VQGRQIGFSASGAPFTAIPPSLKMMTAGDRWRKASSVVLSLLALVMFFAHAAELFGGIELTAMFHVASVLLAPAMVSYYATVFGRRHAAFSSAVLFVGGWGIELLGTHTGFPFGNYSYTSVFQPQLLGVPIEIPTGWLTLGLMTSSMASLGHRGRALELLWASSLMVLWDVLYDPIFVSLGMWTWERGDYFGVPYSNFLGWFLSSLLLLGLLNASPRGPPAKRGALEALAPLAVYFAYAANGFISNIYLGQPMAGILGSAAMVAASSLLYMTSWPSLRWANGHEAGPSYAWA